MSKQYMMRFNMVQQITDRLNCYFEFPPPLMLSLNPAPPKRHSTAVIAVTASVVAAISVVLLVVAGCLVWFLRRHAGVHKLDHVGVLEYSWAEIRRATKRFHRTRLLGGGGFGKVFFGKLRGEVVAVKVTDRKQHSFEHDAKKSTDVSSLEVRLSHAGGGSDRTILSIGACCRRVWPFNEKLCNANSYMTPLPLAHSDT